MAFAVELNYYEIASEDQVEIDNTMECLDILAKSISIEDE